MNRHGNISKDHFATQQGRGLRRAKLKVHRARILVADDDAEMRDLYAAILAVEGYQVSVAADGAEALALLSTRRFQLLLTDRQMPVMGGERLVLALRAAGMRIPVVMVSGSFAHHPLREPVAREVVLALPKPTPTSKILTAVSRALHRMKPAPALVA